jgi:trigger factor
MSEVVERLSELKRKIVLTIPDHDIEEDVQKQLKELSGKVKIKGFRPGKVSLVEVKRRYGQSVRQDVIHNLVAKKLDEVVKEQSLKPVGAPQIEAKTAGDNQPVQYEAIFEVYPEFTLASLKGSKIERLNATITAADIDKVIEKMRRQQAQWKEVTRPAKEGDKMIIDFVGKLEGKEFQGGSANGFELELGSKSMIPGFEEGLIGAEKDQSLTLSLTFPKEYHATDFAGKSAEFDVTVKKITAAELPEIDEEFLKKFDIKEGGVEAFRKDVEEGIQKNIQQNSKEQVKKALIDLLIEKNTFEIPTALIDREIKRTQEEFLEKMGSKDKNLINSLPREHFEKQAINNVKIGLVFSEAIESFKLTVDESRVQSKLEEFAAAYEHASQMVDLYKSNPRSMEYFRSSVLEEQVVEKFLEEVQLVDKQLSYDEFLNPKQKEA